MRREEGLMEGGERRAQQTSSRRCRGFWVTIINNLSLSTPPSLSFSHPSFIAAVCFPFLDAEHRGFYHPPPATAPPPLPPRGTESGLESLILITSGPVTLIFQIYCWPTPSQRSPAPVSPSRQSFVKHSPPS